MIKTIIQPLRDFIYSKNGIRYLKSDSKPWLCCIYLTKFHIDQITKINESV